MVVLYKHICVYINVNSRWIGMTLSNCWDFPQIYTHMCVCVCARIYIGHPITFLSVRYEREVKFPVSPWCELLEWRWWKGVLHFSTFSIPWDNLFQFVIYFVVLSWLVLSCTYISLFQIKYYEIQVSFVMLMF